MPVCAYENCVKLVRANDLYCAQHEQEWQAKNHPHTVDTARLITEGRRAKHTNFCNDVDSAQTLDELKEVVKKWWRC